MSKPPLQVETPATVGEVSHLADHLFRHEAGKLVSVLTGIFGVERLHMAEDVVQEALARALQRWPYHGIPANPAAWLTQTAKNLALDLMRRERLFRGKESQIIQWMEQWTGESISANDARFGGELRDDRLRLMFVCCHPKIPRDAQTALALKTLCGFSPAEIARAYLTSEAAIAKRLTRAKQRIREEALTFEVPSGDALPARLDGVLQTLYLLFNEGYKASSGDKLLRQDLCREAIRLAELLVAHPAGDKPRTHALLALMLFNAARFPTRVDDQGNLLLLKDQDRSRWERGMLARGMYHLARSGSGTEISDYHLQAGIAACHGVARDYESTDWRQIVSLYDQLVALDPSPVVALNRAIALGNLQGPLAGLRAVQEMGNRDKLASYYLFYAVQGEFEIRLGHSRLAADHFRRAWQLTATESERRFLAQRLLECEVSPRRGSDQADE